MVAAAQSCLGGGENVEPGQDTVQLGGRGLAGKRLVMPGRDVERRARVARTVNDHEVTPVADQLIEQLTELSSLVGSLGQQLQGPATVVFQNGAGESEDALVLR